jgi:hypothetical protein
MGKRAFLFRESLNNGRKFIQNVTGPANLKINRLTRRKLLGSSPPQLPTPGIPL